MTAPRPARPVQARRWTALLAAVAVASLIAAAVLGVLFGSTQAELNQANDKLAAGNRPQPGGADTGQQADAQRTAAVDAATKFMTRMTSYDHQNPGRHLDQLVPAATERFAGELRKTSEKLAAAAKQAKASSAGTVRAAAVAELKGNAATVLLFLDQRVHNTSAPDGRVDHGRVTVKLVEEGGRWLVDAVELS